MIRFSKGNIFDSNCKVLVNTINTQGVMGKGLALEVKKRYPEIMPSYKAACKDGLKGGDIHVFNTGNQYIVNLATKEEWKNPSKYEWIEKGLYNLRDWLDHLPYAEKVAVPALGCKNGQLDYHRVKKMIEKVLKNSKHEIIVYEPN